MRLVNVNTLELTEFPNDEAPEYVAASHRWMNGGETTFRNFMKKRDRDGVGYKKVEAFATYVRNHVPDVEWLWIDTCCINQDSAAELSEAVNLMFEWYRNSHICIAYLADVADAGDLGESEWFKRGWTLQELVAPRTLIFVTRVWELLGFKGLRSDAVNVGPNLDRDVEQITGIPLQALSDYKTSLGFSIDERLKWMEGRTTTREEDMSYALYGIFGVTPGANYGERKAGARNRLLTAISQLQELGHARNNEIPKPQEEPRRVSMHANTLRFMRRSIKDRSAESGWTLVDEFDCPPDSVDANLKLFAGGTFMAEYTGDPSTKLYLTLPSSEGDNRADWTIIAPNATFYPGKHSGHLIFPSDFPFRPPSVYWDTPLLSPFPRDGRFSGDIYDVWSPASRSVLMVVETMASLVLRSPEEVKTSTLKGDFVLHTLPKYRGGDLPTGRGEEDWFRQCTQFFCRAYNRIDDGEDEAVDQNGQNVALTNYHREMSCQAVRSFTNHILVDFCEARGPFLVDGLEVDEYFARIDTLEAWSAAEKRWAKMLDEKSGWMVSQDRGGGNMNALYWM
ncbi:hypothetical protein M409DRAFT_18185 [Zasmidium cellare ATCC 36951]|uniref:Heterokaryon incompatibility domain-containing protein n=1 Tax=Zasmidium cellare ATCC 36951 TaxID=1080233 RepID=A0A6A6CXQ7_ZASCE|nr:uncharacterized protein M409DRAFT_18185 [Zasmidium cellare ATCC 36951]KAF2171954.1 hypothetical protein M409DRAFT_18185 [Zasmidium cellare ATCC 36951]